MDTQTIITQLSNAVVALIIAVIGGFGAFAVAWFKLLPDRMKAQQAIAIEKAKNENLMDSAVSNVAQDLTKVFLAQVPIFQKISDKLEGSGGQLTTLKNDVEHISKTLETGSKPLLDIGEQVKRILAIVEDIQKSPHLSEDKAKRLDDAVAQISTVTRQLSELVVALQETQADLLRKKHDSQPIPTITIEKPNGKEQ